jgi:hypothetical protein
LFSLTLLKSFIEVGNLSSKEHGAAGQYGDENGNHYLVNGVHYFTTLLLTTLARLLLPLNHSDSEPVKVTDWSEPKGVRSKSTQ